MVISEHIKSHTLKLVFIFFIIFLFFVENASTKDYTSLNTLAMDLNPKIPGANEEVEIELESFSFKLDSSTISIFINNKLLISKIGLKKFTFKTGDFGKKTDVKILIKKINGKIVEKNLTIIPAEVDLIYEINKPHRPFGYLGKSTILSNSKLTVFAFPSLIDIKGKVFEKENLVYTWYKNFDIDLDKSGYGKYSYNIERLDAYPRDTIISVKVATQDGTIKAEETIYFSPKNTEVSFYLIDPVFPFSFKNIANPKITTKYTDADILAVPYFMNDLDLEETEYEWQIGKRYYTNNNLSNRNLMSLINDRNNPTEEVQLSLQITNRKRILQSLLKSKVSIIFKEETKNNNDDQFFTKGKVERGIEESFSPF